MRRYAPCGTADERHRRTRFARHRTHTSQISRASSLPSVFHHAMIPPMRVSSLVLAFLCALCCVSATAAEGRRPNILFIIFDDWNGSTHAGAYGCDWIKTPNFDRVAHEGVLFKNAFTSNPKCSP